MEEKKSFDELMRELKEKTEKVFNFRNWMAHGRYWDYPHNRGKHNFDAIWIMVNVVENAFRDRFYVYERVGDRI